MKSETMPHITTAMKWSVRRSVADVALGGLFRKDITSDVSSVKNSFSSWDNCMAATYCKWPVIALIIIGGLILLSIVTCIVRCACCGMSCCCTCFRCLSCCDCCGDSCEGKRNKPMKNRDEPGSFNPNPFGDTPPRQGYAAPAPMPMMGGALPAPQAPGPPQYAQFEVGKNGLYVEPKPAAALSDDALPPMPSWDSAAKKQVMTEEEKDAVELGELDPATGQKVPLMSGAAATGISAPPSPGVELGHSPYGARPGAGPGGNGYLGVGGDQYAQNVSPNPGGQFGPGQNRKFNGSPAPGIQSGRGYGSPAPGMQNGRGFGGPQAPGMGGPGRYGSPGPQAMNRPGRGFGPTSPQDPYGPQDPYAAHDQYDGSPVDVVGGYGRAAPQRQYSNDQYSNDSRKFPPGPNRQYPNDSGRPLNPGRSYTDHSGGPGYPADNFQPQEPPRGPSRGPGGPQRLASPPLQNNSGFDFVGGGYDALSPQTYDSRPSPPPQQFNRPSPPPQQMGYGQNDRSRRSPPIQESGYGGFGMDSAVGGGGHNAPSRSPPPQTQGPAYPGYRAYQPPTNTGRSTPGNSRGGGGREPQGWDPVHQ